MPTVYDPKTGTIVTADWQNRKIYSYEYEGEWKMIKDLKGGKA